MKGISPAHCAASGGLGLRSSATTGGGLFVKAGIPTIGLAGSRDRIHSGERQSVFRQTSTVNSPWSVVKGMTTVVTLCGNACS